MEQGASGTYHDWGYEPGASSTVKRKKGVPAHMTNAEHAAKSKALKKKGAMEGVSEAVERARIKHFGKAAHLTGKAAIDAEMNDRAYRPKK